MQRKRRETPPPDPFEAYDLEGPRLVRGNEFLISLQYFLERNLCDVASLEITNLCTGTLEVATGLFAHWLHMLIDEIDCRCFLHMTAINRQRCTDIQIPFPASLLSIDKRKEMIILGSLTGATIMNFEWGLAARFDLHLTRNLVVYATTRMTSFGFFDAEFFPHQWHEPPDCRLLVDRCIEIEQARKRAERKKRSSETE